MMGMGMRWARCRGHAGDTVGTQWGCTSHTPSTARHSTAGGGDTWWHFPSSSSPLRGAPLRRTQLWQPQWVPGASLRWHLGEHPHSQQEVCAPPVICRLQLHPHKAPAVGVAPSPSSLTYRKLDIPKRQ